MEAVKLATHQPDFGSQRPSEAVGHSRRPTQVGVSRTVVSLRHLFTPPAFHTFLFESATGGQRKSAQAITLIGCSHYRCLLVRRVIATRRLKYREAKSLPFRWDSWDLITEKVCIEVNGERKMIFRSRLNCATNYTYDVCQS